MRVRLRKVRRLVLRECLREAVAQPVCGRCGKHDPFWFYVPDWVWDRVVTKKFRGRIGGALCLRCFDDMAARRGIEWCRRVRLCPVSTARMRRPVREADVFREAWIGEPWSP